MREEYRAIFARRLTEKESNRVYLVAVLESRLVGGITARIDQEYNQAKSVALGSLNPGGDGRPFGRMSLYPAARGHANQHADLKFPRDLVIKRPHSCV